MMVSHPSTPQHRTLQRSLWPSPAFSDYFSGNEDSFSPNQANGAKVTPKQQRLLSRLNEIGLQVLRNDPGGQTPSIEKELDYVEQALNAPDSQSRAPAELADSGLFIDDEAEEPSEDYKQALYEEGILRERKKQEGREVLSRIGRATEQLRERYEDLKHINDLATTRLQLAADELFKLRTENKNFHTDLSDMHSSLLFLKMQLKALEVQAAPYINSDSGKVLRSDIERWKKDWKGVESRLKGRRHIYERPALQTSHSLDTGLGNGMSSRSMHSNFDSSPSVYRSKLTIKRLGLLARADSDPSLKEVPSIENPANGGVTEPNCAQPQVNGESKPAELEAKAEKAEAVKKPEEAAAISQPEEVEVVNKPEKAAAVNKPEKVEPINMSLKNEPVNKAEEHVIVSDEEESDQEQEPEPAPVKTPWQELWDSLTEYAGIMEYD